MNILVLNTGSSSIKYELFEVDPPGHQGGGEASLTGGLIERIGEPGGLPDHEEGLRAVLDRLRAEGHLEGLAAVGHRVVHGGEWFTAPTVIDDAVIAQIEALAPLAPLHNPPALAGIRGALAVLGDLPHVAVFDTAFHSTIPPAAHRYALPDRIYADHGVRRYGFHGTSHAYVAAEAARALGRDLLEMRIITLHLGNGASATAIDRGRSVDTSMGFTPLEGLVMGTRSGDLDPAVVLHLLREGGMDVDEVDVLLNRESGLKGLCGANDLREVERRAGEGDPAAELALDVYCRRIRKYVGAYLAVLGGLDALVFTAGVGQHSVEVRRRVAGPLAHLGLRLDRAANASADCGDGPVVISSPGSPAAILVVATDEERMIAREVRTVVGI